MRDRGRRFSNRPWLQTMIYVAQWLLLSTLLTLPWTIYTGFFREHAYGLATQGFGDWSLDQLKGLLVSLIILPPVLALLYRAVRKTGDRWWIWASGGAFVLILFFMMIAPVFHRSAVQRLQAIAPGRSARSRCCRWRGPT